MARTEDSHRAETTDERYSMDKPRVGMAVIVNNLAEKLPRSQADVQALQTVYEHIGFEVHSYREHNKKKFADLIRWLTRYDAHAHCNTLSVNILSDCTDQGILLDVDGRKMYSLNQLLADLHGVTSLKDKPITVILQLCAGSISGLTIPDDGHFFVACNAAEDKRLYPPDSDSFLQKYANNLEQHYTWKSTRKSYDEIVMGIEQEEFYKKKLSGDDLVTLSSLIPYDEMVMIAEGQLGFEPSMVENWRETSNQRSILKLLQMWKNTSMNDDGKKLWDLLQAAANKRRQLNLRSIHRILKDESDLQMSEGPQFRNGLKKLLYLNCPPRKTQQHYELSSQRDKESKAKDCKISMLESTISELREELREKEQRCHEMRRENNGLKERITELEKEVRRLKNEVEKIKLEMIASCCTSCKWTSSVTCVTVGQEKQVVTCGSLSFFSWFVGYKLLCFKPEENRLKKLPNKDLGCTHYCYLLALSDNSGRLAISCKWCKVIRVRNIDTDEEENNFAFKGKRFGRMCRKDSSTIFVCVQGGEVLELKMNGQNFIESNSFPTKTRLWKGICYVKIEGQPEKLILANRKKVCAYKLPSRELLWSKEEIEDNRIDPYGLLFSPNHNNLLVADYKNGRVLVLDPKDGSTVQKLNKRTWGKIYDMCSTDGDVYMRHDCDGEYQISKLAVRVVDG